MDKEEAGGDLVIMTKAFQIKGQDPTPSPSAETTQPALYRSPTVHDLL